MTLGMTILLLAVAIIGIVLTGKYLRKRRALRIVCIVLLSLIALALSCYIGLTLILLTRYKISRPPYKKRVKSKKALVANVSFMAKLLFRVYLP